MSIIKKSCFPKSLINIDVVADGSIGVIVIIGGTSTPLFLI